MAGSAWREAREAVTGALMLARGDARGLARFDTSPAGFWRSFRAGVLCYPLYLALTLLRIDPKHWDASGVFRIFAVETIGYIVSWTAFPLIMLSVCRRLTRDDRFFGFMTAYNWCQVPQLVLFAAIAAAAAFGLLGDSGAAAAGLAAAAAVIVYEWFIARTALDVSVSEAILVVVIDLVLAAVLRQVDDSLY